MKHLTRLSALSCLLAVSAHGQFYAPETEYHDPAQRMYPVEAARVLAWLANSKSNTIAEVSYSLSTATNGATSWKLSWLDAGGKPVKVAKVEYARDLLKAGPEFYREIMRQLLSAGWNGIKPVAASEAAAAFWKGAELAGLSREESLDHAFAMLTAAPNQPDPAWAPRMAGLLVHSALPRFGADVSLDNVLVARGGAWLALTEQACSNGLSRLWAPALFLAGREQAASKVWNTAGANPPSADHGVVAAWNLWLKHPTTKQAFLFATETKTMPVAMSMLAYDVRVNGSGVLLAEVIEPLAGSKSALIDLHNYSPLFALHTGVGGGHIMNGAWPFYQRRAWVDLLAHCPDASKEGLNFLPSLRDVTNALEHLAKPDSEVDACLLGFKETAPLLQMGQKEGVGKLVPAAAVTARDLLNYGWEMTGLQMGARYRFVNALWGVPERAKPILDEVTGEVQGLYPFFKNAQAAHVYNYQECLQRLQQVGSIYSLAGWSPNPFKTDATTSGSAAVFMKRCWLRPELVHWQARSLWDESRTEQIAELVDAAQQEEGPLGTVAVLGYLASIRPDRRGGLPQADQWLAALVEQLPQPTRLSVTAVWEKKFRPMPFLAAARELEKLYWQNPESGMEDWVVLYYAKAGAFGAARRFYVQSRENLLDSVKTSNALGHYAFVLGYLMDDASLRQMALEDSASASYNDMLLHIWDSAIHDDRKQLEEQIDGLIERYESTKGPTARGAKMKQFLPLLPALADPNDPRHREAVSYFGNDVSWVMLRWLWIEKFKLSKEDAITFLGGRETDAARHVFVSYLEGDVEKTVRAADELMHRNDAAAEQYVLAKFLSAKLAKAKEPEVPDLKPADASSARSAVSARLKER